MKKFLLIAAFWVSAVASILFITKVATIGPVIYTISAENGWGIHIGDFLAVIPLAIAIIATVMIKKAETL